MDANALVLSKKDFEKHAGEQVGNKKYIKANNPGRTYDEGPKSKNLSTLSDNEYMDDKIRRFPGMSAQEINNHFGTNVISESQYENFNTRAGLNKVVTYDGTTDREITSTGTPPPPSTTTTTTYTTTERESTSIEGDNTSSDSGKKRLFKNFSNKKKNPKVTGSSTFKCSTDDPTSCGLDQTKQLRAEERAETKGYNKAQKDRIYKVKKDGSQVLKKQFAPGQWFEEKLNKHQDNRSRRESQSSRKKKQRQISRDRKARSKAYSREHQHNNPDNYSKVSNFFNELSYKKDKPKGSRTIKASF